MAQAHGYCPTGVGTAAGFPEQVKGPGGTGLLTGIKAVASGGMTNYALRGDGAVLAWGQNNYGQVGDGSTTPTLYPVAVGGPAASDVTDIASAGWTAYARRSDGTVVSWGYNYDAELGIGQTTPQFASTPLFVRSSATEILTEAVGVYSGFWARHAFAVTADGSVRGWGINNYCATGACGAGGRLYATPGVSRLP